MKKMLSTFLMLIMVFDVSATVFAALPEYGEEYQNQPAKEYSQVFKDVDADFWAFTYIAEMTEREVLSGYPNGNFYPNNTVTRAEFAKIMCLAAGLTVNAVNSTSYDDVKVSSWYAPFVECGKYYLSGYIADGKKYYKPEDKALREDIAVALVKLKGYDTSVYDESILKAMFVDWQSISEGARKYVSVAVENGLISGYEDNTFRGQASITRAEAATLLWRAYQYGNENKVFEKEEFEEPVSNNTSLDITTEAKIEEKLKLTLSVDNTNINVKSGEIAEFAATVEFNFLKNLNDEIPRTGYTPYIDGDVEILENMWGSEKNTQNNETVTLYRTKELTAGKYVLTVSVEDDYSISSEKVTINVTEPEPEYLYELKTIGSGISSIECMIATNDGAFYLSENNVYEVSKDGNSINLLVDSTEIEYLGEDEISKAKKDILKNTIRYIGYDPLLDKRYCIITQSISTEPDFLYDIDSKEAINISSIMRSDSAKYDNSINYSIEKFIINEFGHIVLGGTAVDYKNNILIPAEIKSPHGGYRTQLFVNNNIYITAGEDYGYIYPYNKRIGTVDKALDYNISGYHRIIGADDKYFYFKSDNAIYRVDTNGESEILFGLDDIDNIDGKIINIDAIKYLTAAISPDGTIYYWDVNYNCIRQLSEK